MPTLHIEPFSGASGDMLLAALIDAGADAAALNRELAKIGLDGARVEAEVVFRDGLRGVAATVPEEVDPPHRHWSDIRRMIEGAGFAPRVEARALAVFQAIAEAEAFVHGETVDSVHFHEVGALDSIVDICGIAIALDLLDIDTVTTDPVHIGGGTVRSAHGLLPVPAPATARLLLSGGAVFATPHEGEATAGELLTPTGAAVLTTLATFGRPAITPAGQGVGFGGKTLPWPNMLRVWVGEPVAEPVDRHSMTGSEPLVVLETNLDDMNPQHAELLRERLFSAGALDVWLTPIVMKKGRPAFTVSALSAAADTEALTATMIENSTTLGVRSYRVDRVAADRRTETVTTRWGDVRLKLRGWNGRVIDAVPEHDDCLRLARESESPIREVWNEAHRMGETYIGQRIAKSGDLLVLDISQRPTPILR